MRKINTRALAALVSLANSIEEDLGCGYTMYSKTFIDAPIEPQVISSKGKKGKKGKYLKDWE